MNWLVEQIPGTDGTESGLVNIAYDSSGRPHVCYAVWNDPVELKYAYKNAGSWTIQTVATVDQADWPQYGAFRLAVGGDVVQFVWTTRTNTGGSNYDVAVEHASCAVCGTPSNDTLWTRSYTSAFFGGPEAAITVDAGGEGHVVFIASDVGGYGVNDNTLWYMNEAGGWSASVVYSIPYTGDLYLDDVNTRPLVCDGDGNLHLCYNASSDPAGNNSTQRYGYYSGSWSLEDVEGVAQYNSIYSHAIGVDTAGNPGILYWDAVNSRERYAYKSGGWAIETFTKTAGRVGLVYSSDDVAVVADGRPNNPGGLIYRTNDGGGWVADTWGEGLYWPGQLDVALNSADSPGVVFADGFSGVYYAIPAGYYSFWQVW